MSKALLHNLIEDKVIKHGVLECSSMTIKFSFHGFKHMLVLAFRVLYCAGFVQTLHKLVSYRGRRLKD